MKQRTQKKSQESQNDLYEVAAKSDLLVKQCEW